MSLLKLKPWAVDTSLRKFGGKYIVTYWYWTNFNHKRATYGDYEVIRMPGLLDPPEVGYWEFETNLTFEDIDQRMDIKARNRFLYKMFDIYNKGDVME